MKAIAVPIRRALAQRIARRDALHGGPLECGGKQPGPVQNRINAFTATCTERAEQREPNPEQGLHSSPSKCFFLTSIKPRADAQPHAEARPTTHHIRAKPRLAPALRHEYYLAARLPVMDVLVRSARFCEGKHAIDARLELTLFVHFQQ
jgi:hypothetical protein